MAILFVQYVFDTGTYNLINLKRDEKDRLIAMNFNVYVYPKYDMNLHDFYKKHYEEFNDDILYSIFHQCAKSLKTLAKHKHTHNDIKPQNFLVKFKAGKDDLNNLEVVLTDFGLAGQNAEGGTPIFASPECFNGTSLASDMYSLGRVFLFLILPKRLFSKLLFVPVCDDDSLGSKIHVQLQVQYLVQKYIITDYNS